MAASFQAKDSLVLEQQLSVQELSLKASNGLVSVSGPDLIVSLKEKIDSVVAGLKQIAAGTLTGVVVTIQNDANGEPTQLKIAGEAAAAASTAYILKYVTK